MGGIPSKRLEAIQAGSQERPFQTSMGRRSLIPFQNGLALTGVKGAVEGGAGPGPSVAVIGELDSLRVLEHPYHDEVTGAAHACGHHCQIGSMMGAMIGLMAPEVIGNSIWPNSAHCRARGRVH